MFVLSHKMIIAYLIVLTADVEKDATAASGLRGGLIYDNILCDEE